MELEQSFDHGGDAIIERVDSDASARAFANVQLSAFLERSDTTRDWWKRCFVDRALINFRDPAQNFLMIKRGGRAASVMLTVATGDVTGLYAVATRPEWQGQGLSSQLLSHVAGQVVPGRRLVLQAVSGSAAEQFYRKRGFRTRFRVSIWRRPSAPLD